MQVVERQRLSEQVARHLRALIVDGEIAAGQTLPPEREMARRFAVSSTVIREALRTLSAGGLVEIRHGVGSFVTTPDRWHTAEPIAALLRGGQASLLHVLEVRAMIEIETAALAAARCDTRLLAALDATLTRMAASVDDPVANVQADLEFHRALAAGAANPVLQLVLQPILAPILTGMLRGAGLPAATARALVEHRHIRDAVAAGDAAAAQAAMRAHMTTAAAEIAARERILLEGNGHVPEGVQAPTPRSHG
jgi:DNA-binding FadR family transcriptional regulator